MLQQTLYQSKKSTNHFFQNLKINQMRILFILIIFFSSFQFGFAQFTNNGQALGSGFIFSKPNNQDLQQLDAAQLEQLLKYNTQSSNEGVQASSTGCYISIPSHGINAQEIGTLNGKPQYYQFSSGFFDSETFIFWENNAWNYIVSFVGTPFGFDRINYDDTPTPPCSGEWFNVSNLNQPFTLALEGCCSSGCDDADGDDVCLEDDNCPDTYNPDQTDSDNDGFGDACDACPFDADNDIDGDGICGDVDACPFDADNDIDGDGVCGDVDNCPIDANADQGDLDADGIGDACDTELDICTAFTAVTSYVVSLSLPNSTANHLFDKLTKAQDKFLSGNDNAAIGNLNAFINKVNAKTPGEITAAENAFLVAAGQMMISSVDDNTGSCDGDAQNFVSNNTNNNISTYQLQQDHIDLKIFPNPARDVLNIHTQGLEEATTVRIFDAMGKMVFEQNFETGLLHSQIDLSSTQFQNGLYLVNVISDNTKLTKRLVISK